MIYFVKSTSIKVFLDTLITKAEEGITMVYGYCRISTRKQSIERQIRNIKNEYPNAVIIEEAYTGTSLNRPEWNKLCKRLKENDTVVFDSVIRMSRNASEGFKLYKELFERQICLVFLKERHIDTQAYKEALKGIVSQTFPSCDDELVNAIMTAVNKFMMNKVEQDIYKAFEQSEKKVDDLRQRTREGIETARLNGRQIGTIKGTTHETKKSKAVKPLIIKYSRDFEGTLTDKDCI